MQPEGCWGLVQGPALGVQAVEVESAGAQLRGRGRRRRARRRRRRGVLKLHVGLVVPKDSLVQRGVDDAIEMRPIHVAKEVVRILVVGDQFKIEINVSNRFITFKISNAKRWNIANCGPNPGST